MLFVLWPELQPVLQTPLVLVANGIKLELEMQRTQVRVVTQSVNKCLRDQRKGSNKTPLAWNSERDKANEGRCMSSISRRP